MATPSKKSMPATGNRKKPMSKSKKCGLTFPVGRITTMLRKGNFAPRVSSTSGVYLAAVVEYLVSEVLDLSAKALAQASKGKKKAITRLTPRAVCLAVRNDPELGALLSNVTLSRGGVVPFVSKALEKKSKKAKKAKKSVKA